MSQKVGSLGRPENLFLGYDRQNRPITDKISLEDDNNEEEADEEDDEIDIKGIEEFPEDNIQDLG